MQVSKAPAGPTTLLQTRSTWPAAARSESWDIGTTPGPTITGNTILENLGQTDAISLDAPVSGQVMANKTVTGSRFGQGYYLTRDQGR